MNAKKSESSNAKTQQTGGHPSGDERYTTIDRTMKLAGYEKDALLEVLHAAQQTFGYLSEDLLIYVSTHLQVPLSQVYGVATFYHLFTFEPLGKHNCIVCAGTACHVKGSAEITAALSDQFDVPVGKTTEDGLFSLTIARCLGSCGLAPVTVVDGAVHGKESASSMIKRIEVILAEEAQALVEGGAG
jgi:bidirectional [NiFe] hydrogenase diaphorase subunit